MKTRRSQSAGVSRPSHSGQTADHETDSGLDSAVRGSEVLPNAAERPQTSDEESQQPPRKVVSFEDEGKNVLGNKILKHWQGLASKGRPSTASESTVVSTAPNTDSEYRDSVEFPALESKSKKVLKSVLRPFSGRRGKRGIVSPEIHTSKVQVVPSPLQHKTPQSSLFESNHEEPQDSTSHQKQESESDNDGDDEDDLMAQIKQMMDSKTEDHVDNDILEAASKEEDRRRARAWGDVIAIPEVESCDSGPLKLQRFPMLQTLVDDDVNFKKAPDARYVGIRVEIFRIYDIDAAGSNFKCDFEVFLEWCDPDLVDIDDTGPNEGCFSERSKWRPKWYPGLLFHNQYSTLYHWCDKYKVVDKSIGRVISKQGFRGPFYDVMDLKKFPLDRQVLHIVIATEEPFHQVEFCVHPSGRKNVIFAENLAEWRIDNPFQDTMVHPAVYHDVQGPPSVGFQRHIVQIRVERRHEYYTWNVQLLSFLLVILSVTSWSISPNIVGERLAVTLTLVLSVIAFKFAIAGMLPKVPYLTKLDEYLILTFAMITIVAFENAAVAVVQDLSDDEPASDLQKLIDFWFFMTFIVLWIVVNIFVFLSAHRGWLLEDWDKIEASDETRVVKVERRRTLTFLRKKKKSTTALKKNSSGSSIFKMSFQDAAKEVLSQQKRASSRRQSTMIVGAKR
eukprot:m.314769 g.314769  ORF g.314769 m.314769 type:complete len:675 (+) comp16496_c1_seq2:1590-3614(+)